MVVVRGSSNRKQSRRMWLQNKREVDMNNTRKKDIDIILLVSKGTGLDTMQQQVVEYTNVAVRLRNAHDIAKCTKQSTDV